MLSYLDTKWSTYTYTRNLQMTSMSCRGVYNMCLNAFGLLAPEIQKRHPPHGLKEQTRARYWARGSGSTSWFGINYWCLDWWWPWWSVLIRSYIPFFFSHKLPESMQINILFSPMLVSTNALQYMFFKAQNWYFPCLLGGEQVPIERYPYFTTRDYLIHWYAWCCRPSSTSHH